MSPLQNTAFSGGYLTDCVYPAHFHREIMPVWLHSTLIALGRSAPSLQSAYRWLELGCGSGVSAVVAAATNPNGHFVGIDANPHAIEQAKALADSAGIRNIEFHSESFEHALVASQQAAAPYDFIVSHGVLSWVSQAARLSMHKLIHALLKPGGVVYVSYASQPGSAGMASAQKIMHQIADLHAGDTALRTRYAVDFMGQLTQAGAGYLIEQPRMAQEILHLAQRDILYTAHEMTNPHWESLHCADVIAGFEAMGCDYAGSAARLENLDAASIPQQCQPLLADLKRQGASVATLETFKDIARNQSQRRDLYQRAPLHGDHRLPPNIHRQNLLNQRVCLMPGAPGDHHLAGAQLRIDTRIGPLEIPMKHLRPMLKALQVRPMAYAELASLPAYANQPGQINQWLQCLADIGWLHYVRADADGLASTASPAVKNLNKALTQRPVGVPARTIEAVELIGGAVSKSDHE